MRDALREALAPHQEAISSLEHSRFQILLNRLNASIRSGEVTVTTKSGGPPHLGLLPEDLQGLTTLDEFLTDLGHRRLDYTDPVPVGHGRRIGIIDENGIRLEAGALQSVLGWTPDEEREYLDLLPGHLEQLGLPKNPTRELGSSRKSRRRTYYSPLQLHLRLHDTSQPDGSPGTSAVEPEVQE